MEQYFKLKFFQLMNSIFWNNQERTKYLKINELKETIFFTIIPIMLGVTVLTNIMLADGATTRTFFIGFFSSILSIPLGAGLSFLILLYQEKKKFSWFKNINQTIRQYDNSISLLTKKIEEPYSQYIALQYLSALAQYKGNININEIRHFFNNKEYKKAAEKILFIYNSTSITEAKVGNELFLELEKTYLLAQQEHNEEFKQFFNLQTEKEMEFNFSEKQL